MISLVIPCFNEDEVLDSLYERVTRCAESWGDTYEVIIVDDGSGQKSWEHEVQLHRKDTRWKLVRFARNFGHQTAVSAGLRFAQGDCVAIIDADLQDPPEQIVRFLEKWREGYHVVYAIRRKRKEGPLKKLCYSVFYRILGMMADVDIPYDSGDFCIMDRKVVDVLNSMPERNRFVRGLRAWAGFRHVGLEYERDARAAGEVKYTFGKLLQLAFDGIFSFSTVPLRLAMYMGFLVSSLSLLGAVFTFLQRVFAEQFSSIGLGPVPGFATTVIAILFLGGVQLICLGIIGEYLGRVYEEVKQRPLWTVQEMVGFDSNRTAS